MKKRIAVIGAGAIGGIVAGLMARAGEDVTLVCRHEDTVQICRAPGLHLTGHCGDMTVPVRAVRDVEDLEGSFDFCLIVTKAYDMPDAAQRMLPHLKADSLVVSMQNGICTDRLADIVGAQRTVGCVIGFGATLHAHGSMEMTSGGELIIGQTVPGQTEQMQALREALSYVTATRISDRIYEELYSKMIVNACITSLGAICGLLLGQMMNRRDARRIFLGIIREAVQVADRLNLKLPPYGGKLDYAHLMHGNSLLDDARRHVTIWVVGVKYRHLKSSSLQSLERGQKTEVDGFNGYIAEKGHACGVDCPVNARLVEMIHEIEQGKRKICTDNLQDAGLVAHC